MSEYIRQLSEDGLKRLGYLMNHLNSASEVNTSHEALQYVVASAALEIEAILKDEIHSIEYSVKL